MARVSLAVVACLCALALSLPLAAQSKKCPDGMVYNPQTNKCVTPRGSF